MNDLFYESLKYMDFYDHPSGNDLYIYFTGNQDKQLSLKERIRITAHLGICQECHKIGNYMEKTEMLLNVMLAIPEIEEDNAAVERSLRWFHTWLDWKKRGQRNY